jgi:hypothetical protein
MLRARNASLLKRVLTLVPSAQRFRDKTIPMKDDLRYLMEGFSSEAIRCFMDSYERSRADGTSVASSESKLTERHQHEEKQRLEQVSQSQLPSPVAASTLPAQPEADKPSAEAPKVVHPLPSKPSEPEHVKSQSSSSGGTGGKSPSNRLDVGRLVESEKPPQPAPPMESAAPMESRLLLIVFIVLILLLLFGYFVSYWLVR